MEANYPDIIELWNRYPSSAGAVVPWMCII